MKKYNRYSEQFKRTALSLYKKAGVSATAKKLDMPQQTLRNWVAKNNSTTQASVVKVRNTYSEDIKREAIRLRSEIGTGNAAKKLGIDPSLVSKWSLHGKYAVSKTEPSGLKEEAKKLRAAINHFLKSCASMSAANTTKVVDSIPDDSSIVRVCKHCGRKYIAKVPYQKYCEERCRTQYYANNTRRGYVMV